jgi:16S rRNA processing protein RimM
LEEGAAYVSDVVGCEVWIRNAQQLLGTVSEVQFGAGEAPLLVVRAKIGAEQEILVPYAEEFLKSADFRQRRIEMELPEGLLALESPLSGEEKQRQKSEADESRSAGVRRKRRK